MSGGNVAVDGIVDLDREPTKTTKKEQKEEDTNNINEESELNQFTSYIMFLRE